MEGNQTSTPIAGENSSGAMSILPTPTSSFEDRLNAVEKMKANLVAEARTRLEEVSLERRHLDAEEARLRDFLGMDKLAAPAAPEPEKKAKAPRGSVRGPVEAFYWENASVTTELGVRVAYATSAVAKETGLDLDQVQGAASKLAKDGILERIGKSSYRWKQAAA